MSTHYIHVFISHSWSYSDVYETLRNWIFVQPWHVGQASLRFRDFSVPRNDPIHDANDRELQAAIYRKIARSHVVVIPTGMYVNYSKWIQKEIRGAKDKSKPILGVNPRGQKRKSSVVLDVATEEAGWTGKSVVTKIWELYRM